MTKLNKIYKSKKKTLAKTFTLEKDIERKQRNKNDVIFFLFCMFLID